MGKKLKAIENIIFIAGIALGLYALVTTYFINKNLPPGVCPVDNNRNLIYISIGLLITSLIFPYIVNKVVQIQNKDQ